MQLVGHTRQPRGLAAAGLDREILVVGAVVVLGTIMAILDVTIVNVAVPTLGTEFGASISTIHWVLTGYLLAFASVIPLSGWATERFGAQRVWLASLLLFMLGSALSGAAWSAGSLIGFRAVQGLGGGMILPVGQTILAQAAGPQRMGRVMSVIGVPLLLGPIFGPVLGGAILGAASWRWVFFINLPVGVLAVFAAHRLLPEAKPQRRQRLDLRGLALLSPGIALVLYGLSDAANRGGFGNTSSVVAGALGLALIVSFVAHARARGNQALIDVSLFLRRGFATAAGVNLLLGIALFGSLILLPLYYQVVRGESALATGLLLAPQGAGAAVAMPLAGALFVVGVGIGSTIMPSMAAAFGTLSRDAVPRATSAINVVQRIAGAVGTALLAVVLQRSVIAGRPDLDGGLQGLASLSQGQRAEAAPVLAGAFGRTFWVAVALIAAALVPALLLPRLRRDHADVSGQSGERKAA